MPVPTSLSDLSTTPGSNYPQGTDVPSALDDSVRALSSIVKRISVGTDALATPALGTPASGVLTNCTGTASGLTAGAATSATTATAANGINSATTTVVVNGATAPSSGQVLTATSSTAANWQSLSGVTTFNTRSGAVTLQADDVTGLVGSALAKAYVYFDASGNNLGSYGVSGVTKNATGDYTISFSSNFSNVYYSACFMGDASGGSFDNFGVCAVRSALVGSCRVMTGSIGTGGSVPVDRGMRIVFFGS